MTCLYTWTDKVNHQCERGTKQHLHHVCPCGAQTIAPEPPRDLHYEAVARRSQP